MKNLFIRDKLKGIWILVFMVGVCSMLSCSTHTVRVYHAPRIDLTQYERLGIINFTDNAVPSVGRYATQQFQEKLHNAQVGVPILELGTKEEVLRSVGASELNFNAFKKIGEKYNVVAVFSGDVNYADIETDFDIQSLNNLNADWSTKLSAILTVKLTETQAGATIWSDSASWNRNLGKVKVSGKGGISVGMDGYEGAYRKLIPDMVHDVTGSFRGYYVNERVPKQ